MQHLKQRVPLLDYLLRRNWTARPIGSHQEFVGLCPLHPESHASFYVNAAKDVFYCHGCGRGGDLIRFVQLSLNLSFHETLAHLKQELSLPEPAEDEVLREAVGFYRRANSTGTAKPWTTCTAEACMIPSSSANWISDMHPEERCGAT